MENCHNSRNAWSCKSRTMMFSLTSLCATDEWNINNFQKHFICSTLAAYILLPPCLQTAILMTILLFLPVYVLQCTKAAIQFRYYSVQWSKNVMRISKPFLVVSVHGLDAGEFARQHLLHLLVMGTGGHTAGIILITHHPLYDYPLSTYVHSFTTPDKISQASPSVFAYCKRSKTAWR